jgi:hypothetical protein
MLCSTKKARTRAFFYGLVNLREVTHALAAAIAFLLVANVPGRISCANNLLSDCALQRLPLTDIMAAGTGAQHDDNGKLKNQHFVSIDIPEHDCSRSLGLMNQP